MIVRFLILILLTTPALSYDESWILDKLNTDYTPISEDPDAVLLFSDTQYSFKSDVVNIHVKEIFHITSLEGIYFGNLVISTIKGSRVSDIHGYRYDSTGDFVEKLDRKDILRTGFSSSFFDDNEQVSASFKNVEKGDYVAFEYRHKRKMYLKDLFISIGGDFEVAYKRVQFPENVFARVINDPDNIVKTPGNGVFLVEKQVALKKETSRPPIRELIPIIAVFTGSGQGRTWREISKTYWEETKDLYELSPKSLVDLNPLLSITDKAEFIKSVMEYVTDTVRYIDIEYRKGRVIPRKCEFVHQKKYGDCKDMAFYATAILRKGGVTAFPVLARAKSTGPVFETLPFDQFNHVIVAVELNSESLDLKNAVINDKPYLIADPTDKFTELPRLGYHLENTNILPVTQEGGQLCNLPPVFIEQNTISYDIQLKYLADKSVQVKLIETKSGHPARQEKAFRESLDMKKEREPYLRWINKMVPGSTLTDYSIDESETQVVTELQFSATDFGSEVNHRIYLMANIVGSHKKGYRKRQRSYDVVYKYLLHRTINLEVEIDPVFKISSIPETVTLDNAYFNYATTATQKDNHITIKTEMNWKADRIPSDQYKDFRKVYRAYLKQVKSPVTVEH